MSSPLVRSAKFFLAFCLIPTHSFAQQPSAAGTPAADAGAKKVFGFRDFSKQAEWDNKFIAVPDTKLADEHLRTLTSAPHAAGTPEDKATAEYVAQKFREAGLKTQIVEYKIWMNYPKSINVSVTAPANVKMNGPRREDVGKGLDPYQDDPRVLPAFNGYSPSGVVEADVVYANYGSPADFKKLKELNIDVRGKIVIVRYGQNFRGVKSFVAEENGAAGVIIYSDPIDDGYIKGDKYPVGPWRPDSAVQRGSVQYLFKYPGDPTTPGFASTTSLPDSKRLPLDQVTSLPKLPTTPISYADATPILENLRGPATPREWQGALPFTYHVGPGPVRVKIDLQQDYAYRTIWDVIGTVPGSETPEQWVLAGNHRDAWVYGAVDPNSGTAAMLETVHGIGALLKSGWKPKRTLVFGSWDAEEYGLIGSTEWVEEHEKELTNAAAYFNMDVAVSGPKFGASSVPSMKQFIREVTMSVPSGSGSGTVYDVWKKAKQEESATASPDLGGSQTRPPATATNDVPVGDLGSGSDYTPFIQRMGVPSSDIGSSGDYGVYHSVFDNFAWFKKFGDPTFVYEQQMARIFGIQMLHMADADVLPLDYALYGHEIEGYLVKASQRAEKALRGPDSPDFTRVMIAARRFTAAGEAVSKVQHDANASDATLAKVNRGLMDAERALLIPEGLPRRPWFRHAIYAPGEYTGYAAVVVPGVNEAIDANDAKRAQQQLTAVTAALHRAAQVLENCTK
ncbi:MAG: Glutamate carboxypeptidase [Acidobacteriales bacterium]|nr:Glutamate carboxypeptidase [Terriglobales bacterium]